jgi:hypothetical protein
LTRFDDFSAEGAPMPDSKELLARRNALDRWYANGERLSGLFDYGQSPGPHGVGRAARRGGRRHGSNLVTLEEAMRIASHRLPGEPEDAFTNCRAARPPEPQRAPQKLDTMQIDWASVIRMALKGEWPAGSVSQPRRRSQSWRCGPPFSVASRTCFVWRCKAHRR